MPSGEYFGLAVGKIVADYLHRANYSYSAWYANCESVHGILEEAIFVFASEANSKEMQVRSEGVVDGIAQRVN